MAYDREKVPDYYFYKLSEMIDGYLYRCVGLPDDQKSKAKRQINISFAHLQLSIRDHREEQEQQLLDKITDYTKEVQERLVHTRNDDFLVSLFDAATKLIEKNPSVDKEKEWLRDRVHDLFEVQNVGVRLALYKGIQNYAERISVEDETSFHKLMDIATGADDENHRCRKELQAAAQTVLKLIDPVRDPLSYSPNRKERVGKLRFKTCADFVTKEEAERIQKMLENRDASPTRLPFKWELELERVREAVFVHCPEFCPPPVPEKETGVSAREHLKNFVGRIAAFRLKLGL